MSLPRFRFRVPTTLAALVLWLSGVAVLHGQAALPHPLDPLTAEDITAAVEILRTSARLGADIRFSLVFRQEPDKPIVLGHQPGDEFPRIAVCVLLHRKTGRTSEAKIDLRSRQLLSHNVLEDMQSPVIFEEFLRGEEIVRHDKRWQKAMRKRGLTDDQFPDISVDCWSAGFVPGREGQRLMRAISYLRGETDNHIPRVIEGVIALVDITNESVVELTDSGVVPVPPESLDVFNPRKDVARRPKLKPLRTELPDGANFSLDGHEVRWQNWSLRHSWHPREGLVLHQIAYHDGTDSRPILYRASLSEMLVPYADPSEAWQWRSAFDLGEYRMGSQLIAVRPGFEIPEHATVMPAVMCGDDGEIRSMVNAWGIYEQDGGIQWLHVDPRARRGDGRTETRRARQLVLHSLYNVGNYDYGVRWILGQDGTIHVEVELTGLVLPKGVDDHRCPVCRQAPDAEGRLIPQAGDRYGTLVSSHIVATHHQHFFNFRLDFDVDGVQNSVYEMELEPEILPPDHLSQNAFLLTKFQRVSSDCATESGLRRNR
jgi:primary-amine oxidase